MSLWIAALTWRRHAPGSRWTEAIPTGYGAPAAGVVLFLISRAAHFAWHSVFGTEQGIKALFSPSHLGLATGGFLILGAPFSAAWHSPERSWPRLIPAVVSAMLSGMVAAFILQEFAVFARNGLIRTYIGAAGAQPAATIPTSSSIMVSLASFFVSTAVLFVPVLLLSLRWRLHAAVPAAMALLPSVALQIMIALRDAWLVPVALLGAVLVGVVWAVVRPKPDRHARLMTAMGLSPSCSGPRTSLMWRSATGHSASPLKFGAGRSHGPDSKCSHWPCSRSRCEPQQAPSRFHQPADLSAAPIIDRHLHLRRQTPNGAQKPAPFIQGFLTAHCGIR